MRKRSLPRSIGPANGSVRAHVIDVLRGTATEKVERAGHDRLPTFGMGAARGKNEWRSLIRQMVATGLLRLDIGGYGGLSITGKGGGLLQGESVFLYRRDTAPARSSEPVRDSGGRRRKEPQDGPLSGPDTALLDALKALRLRLAKERAVPGVCRVPRSHLDRHGAPPAADGGRVRRGKRSGRRQAQGFRNAVSGRY